MATILNSSRSFAGRAGTYGFLIIGTSAGLGSIHFLGIGMLDPVYHFLVGLSSYAGVPLIGIGYYHLGIKRIHDSALLPIFGALLVAYVVFTYFIPIPILATVLGGTAMVMVIIVCLRKLSGGTKNSALFGIAGAVLFILAGLVIGTT
ncbi:MAG: hypothetical protein K8R21_10625, partial [Leptospira sp.]|nr:hypothetical protein [Leptospira sp.]